MSFFRYRTKRWVFKLNESLHKVELRITHGQKVTLTVDGDVLEWRQTWLDILDFGGKFDFVLHSGVDGAQAVTTHKCCVVINFVHTYLFVDGVDVVTGRRTSISTGRTVIRLVIIALVLLFFLYVFFDLRPRHVLALFGHAYAALGGS